MKIKKWSEVWKGEYDNNTQYFVGDFVIYQGPTYTCIANSEGKPPTNTSYWRLVSLKGDKGDKGLNWRGEWNSNASYQVDDAVSYQGSSYICIQANIGVAPTNDSYWQLLARNGIGDVVGPNSATDGAVVLFDGTTGKLIKDSQKLLPSGDIVGTDDEQTLSKKTIVRNINTQTTNYTLVLSDSYKIVIMNSSSSLTLTVPNNSSVSFSIGTMIPVKKGGSGDVEISGASGVTINAPFGNIITEQNQYGVLIKVDTNTWDFLL